MRIFLCILLLGWVYFTESVIYKNMKHTLENSKRFNVSNDEVNQPLRSLRRYKRSDCGKGLFYDEEAKYCCRLCPEGQYVEKPCVAPDQDPVCKPCEEGTFLAHYNYVSKCRLCTQCDPDTEVEEVKCSENTDAKCACKEGYYLHADQCTACATCHNRNTIKNCSTTSNTQCGGCLSGFYEEQNECKPCLQSGKQCDISNTSCSPVCDPVVSDIKVEEVKCSENTDAKCACKEGYYLHADQCTACATCHNRSIIKNCSTTSNTQCGGCLSGFYEEQKGCKPCLQSSKQCENTNTSCSPVCEPVVSAISTPYILIWAVLLILLPIGGFLIHKHKRKKKQNGELILTVKEEGAGPGLSDISQETRILFPETSAGRVPSVLQKSCTLYDIIDCVPVRRWKEFMRTLELPDKVIEIVEVEISNFRDQQYEMLRRWCQLKMASVDAVYKTLERMNLSRCAEELKAKIECYS